MIYRALQNTKTVQKEKKYEIIHHPRAQNFAYIHYYQQN